MVTSFIMAPAGRLDQQTNLGSHTHTHTPAGHRFCHKRRRRRLFSFTWERSEAGRRQDAALPASLWSRTEPEQTARCGGPTGPRSGSAMDWSVMINHARCPRRRRTKGAPRRTAGRFFD